MKPEITPEITPETDRHPTPTEWGVEDPPRLTPWVEQSPQNWDIWIPPSIREGGKMLLRAEVKD